ncbi:MAG: DEAD/DEAH box helicase [Thermoguttaceae bacterium]|nr:DEAD/DEAH box helicase [Thermoguttaceae bacterium]
MSPASTLQEAEAPAMPARSQTGRKTRRAGRRKPEAAQKKISRLRKPDNMSLDEWQVELRRQFGREQKFRIRNLGDEPIFSEFEVANPQTRRVYRVAIRGRLPGDNFCSCPDFAVNTLGTCKHVEFTLARLERKPGGKAALAAGFQPAYSEIYLRYGPRRDVVFRAGTECPAELVRYARRFFDAEGRLTEDSFARFPDFLKRALSGEHEVRCYDDALVYVGRVRDRALLAERIDQALPRGAKSALVQKLLRTKLYPYQCEGALFAARAGRCLIADDMGLGKTIQAIAATEILARTMGIQRVLIVCPTSLKHQWQREIEKFTGRESTVIEGLLARREALYRAEGMFKITNYDVICRDLDFIRQWQPDLVILDEAQRIKNWKTRTAQSVKRIESEYAFVLTGTPLENRLEELYSIVEFVDRFRLGPMFRFLDAHQHVDETGRVVGYRNLGKISETLKPILIRRTKQEVLPELPERIDKRLFLPMTPQQMKHHEENRETVGRIVQKWKRFGFLSESDQQRLMIALQNMRMSCNSTYLLDKKTDYGFKADEALKVLSDVLEMQDSKVVVFSQWLRMHELVERRLKARKLGHVLFHGGVPGRQRKELVRQFREDPDCRLFLSTDAGGVGLNLQHADVVLNLDQPWNPAVLEQRIGRVHRLGQHRPVRVVHLIAQGTIEEGMLSLLSFKTAVFSGVLDGGKDEVFLGGTRLKRFMESVESATGSIPAGAPVQRTIEGNDAGNGHARPPSGEQRRREPGGERSPEEAWSDVVTAGMSLLEGLSRALGGGGQPGAGQSGLPRELVERDAASGRSYLKLPLPEPDVMEKLMGLLGALVKK